MPEKGTTNVAPSRGIRAGFRVPFILAVVLIPFAVVAINGNPASAVSRIALPLVLAAVIGLAAVGAGRAIVSLFGQMLDRHPEREEGRAGEGPPELRTHSDQDPIDAPRNIPTLLILGYPILGAIEFLVALVSTHIVALFIPVILLAIIGVWTIIRHRRPDRGAAPGLSVLPILALLLLTSTTIALLPAVSLDEVSYHLAIPKIWVAEGSAVDLPLMSHSYFPLGTESAALPAIALLGARGAVASHLAHLFIAIAAFVVAARALPRSESGALSFVGVAAIASTPAILLGSGWSGTDILLIAISLVLFLAFDRALRTGEGVAVVAASVAAGLLVKYTFLPVAGLLVLCALVTGRRLRAPLLKSAVVGGIAGSVFFIRNLILTGNPIEPFLSSGGGAIARFRWSGSWGDTVIAYMFDTRFIDDSLGFILPGLALASIAILRVIEPAWRRWAALSMIAMGAALTIIGPSGRILLPFLVIPAWIAFASMVEGKGKAGRVAAGLALVVALLIQLAVSWLHLDRLDPLLVVSGRVADEEWVARHRRSQELVEQGNQLLDPERKTLVLGVNELFWFDGRVTGGANFDSDRISSYLSGEAGEVVAKMRADGIEAILIYPNHVRVGEGEAGRSEQQRSLVLTPRSTSILGELLARHATEVARQGEAILYRI